MTRTRTKTKVAATDDDLCCASVVDAPLAEDEAIELSRVLGALADPVRLRLISLVASQVEICSCDLEAPLGKSQPTVSHHTKVLADAGLLVGGEARQVDVVACGLRSPGCSAKGARGLTHNSMHNSIFGTRLTIAFVEAGTCSPLSRAARRLARRSRSTEYQTHLPRRSPCTNPASLRTFRWWETVPWLLPTGSINSQTQTSPCGAAATMFKTRSRTGSPRALKPPARSAAERGRTTKRTPKRSSCRPPHCLRSPRPYPGSSH